MRYIGYATLEKFLARVDSFQTLYLILLEETMMNGVGLGKFRSELLAQASIWNGSEDTIYYWRMVIGEAIAPGGEPWPERLNEIRVAGKSALESVKSLLAQRPTVKQIEEGAMISMPIDLRLLRGHSESLEFNKDSGTYRLKQSSTDDSQTNGQGNNRCTSWQDM